VDLVSVVGHGFDLDEQKGRDLVFVAMGTGVAPLRSALRHVLNRKEDFGQLVVLYGARTPDDFCYRDETQSWEDAGVELRQVTQNPMDTIGRGPPAMSRRCWIMCCGFEFSGGFSVRLTRNDSSRPAIVCSRWALHRGDPDELLVLHPQITSIT